MIDLYQVHQPNPVDRRRHDDARHAGAARRRPRRRGRRLELPAAPAGSAPRPRSAAPVLSNQVQFSLVARGPMADLLPWAQRTGHVVMAYSPLGQGLLSGRYYARQPARRAGSAPRTRCSCRRTSTPPRRCCRCCARSARATASPPAQIALAWLVHHPNVVAIPGASSVAQVESNAAAAEISARAPTSSRALTAAAEAFRPTHRRLGDPGPGAGPPLTRRAPFDGNVLDRLDAVTPDHASLGSRTQGRGLASRS